MLEIINPRLVNVQNSTDHRGNINIYETGKELPFTPERIFIISGTKQGISRGGHAHKQCSQFFIVTCGKAKIYIKNRNEDFNFSLDSPNIGLYIPTLNWVKFTFLVPNTIITVIASHRFDSSDYLVDQSDL